MSETTGIVRWTCILCKHNNIDTVDAPLPICEGCGTEFKWYVDEDDNVEVESVDAPAQDASDLATVQAERDAYRLTLQEIKNMKVAPDVMAVTVALLQIQNAAAEALRFRP